MTKNLVPEIISDEGCQTRPRISFFDSWNMVKGVQNEDGSYSLVLPAEQACISAKIVQIDSYDGGLTPVQKQWYVEERKLEYADHLLEKPNLHPRFREELVRFATHAAGQWRDQWRCDIYNIFLASKKGQEAKVIQMVNIMDERSAEGRYTEWLKFEANQLSNVDAPLSCRLAKVFWRSGYREDALKWKAGCQGRGSEDIHASMTEENFGPPKGIIFGKIVSPEPAVVGVERVLLNKLKRHSGRGADSFYAANAAEGCNAYALTRIFKYDGKFQFARVDNGFYSLTVVLRNRSIRVKNFPGIIEVKNGSEIDLGQIEILPELPR